MLDQICKELSEKEDMSFLFPLCGVCVCLNVRGVVLAASVYFVLYVLVILSPCFYLYVSEYREREK